MIALIMTGAVLNYLTRSTLSVAAPTILKELQIDAQHYSWITGAFQGAIMLQPLAGYVLDSLGLKMGFAIFAFAWSLINMAHGLAHSWQGLIGLCALLGLAEGSANPAGMKATAEWFPAKERGLAGGIYRQPEFSACALRTWRERAVPRTSIGFGMRSGSLRLNGVQRLQSSTTRARSPGCTT